MEGRLDSLDMVHSDWLGMMHLDLPNVVGLEWCCQLKLAEVASALWYFLSCRIRVGLAPLPTPLLRANLKLVCHVFENLGMGQTVKTRGIKFLRWKHKTFPNQSQLKKIYFWSLKRPMSTFSPRKEEFLNESSKKKWWVQILTTWREDREMNRWTEWTIITTKQTNISTNGLTDQIDELREIFGSMRRWMKRKEPKKKGLTEERDNGSAQMLQNKSSVYIVDVYII